MSLCSSFGRTGPSQADFGSATLGLKDSTFAAHLAAAKPSGVPFDPNA